MRSTRTSKKRSHPPPVCRNRIPTATHAKEQSLIELKDDTAASAIVVRTSALCRRIICDIETLDAEKAAAIASHLSDLQRHMLVHALEERFGNGISVIERTKIIADFYGVEDFREHFPFYGQKRYYTSSPEYKTYRKKYRAASVAIAHATERLVIKGLLTDRWFCKLTQMGKRVARLLVNGQCEKNAA